ncbi:helix-turn-helix domain-containing protein [Nonomuraea basaltis]|uniref:helix-turn-helix domain-containing protein n=1 Tax=Nonomuraea basaltis TaxID=2495887 RepID=UPI00110C5614|nr:helix-turn-helix transcriptional regulator [Nonomuraea basaltis]TMR87940.1 helix-turn-helix transcriptional regulator [Nonomuraea basaltis]
MNSDSVDAEVVFGLGLRHLRQQRGWTQQELAERLKAQGTSLHQSAVARIEAANRPVRLNEALALARVLEVELPDLLSSIRGVIDQDIAVMEAQRDDLRDQVMMATESAHAARHEEVKLAQAEAQLGRALAEARASSASADAQRHMAETALRDIEMRLAEALARRNQMEGRVARLEDGS